MEALFALAPLAQQNTLPVRCKRFGYKITLRTAMKSIFLASACFVMSVTSSSAQARNQLLPSTEKPTIEVAIYADNTLVNQQTGVNINTKSFRFDASLDKKEDNALNDLKSELLIENTQVLLIRNGRKIAQVNIQNDHRVNDLIQHAQPEDRVTFIFTLAAQRRNGKSIVLSEQPTYTFPIRE